MAKTVGRRYQDPMVKIDGVLHEAMPALSDGSSSWLGRFTDNGWSIKIEPSLGDAEWERYWATAGAAWSEAYQRFDLTRAFKLLRHHFPNHRLTPVLPPPPGKEDVHDH